MNGVRMDPLAFTVAFDAWWHRGPLPIDSCLERAKIVIENGGTNVGASKRAQFVLDMLDSVSKLLKELVWFYDGL